MSWCYYSNGKELNIKMADAKQCSHQGQCDEDVEYVCNLPYMKRQLAKIERADLVTELKGHGCWDDLETVDIETLRQRLVWTLACNLVEERGK